MIRLYHGTTSKKASKIVGNDTHQCEGFRPGLNHSVYFAEDVATALFFACGRAAEADAVAAQIQNANGNPKFVTVVELSIPALLAKNLRLSAEYRMLLGEFAGLSFPDIPYGSGFELIVSDSVILEALNARLKDGTICVRRLKFSRTGSAQI